MSLIETLGGYEEAKRQGEKWGFDDHLNNALLEYRRENNIFETGDKVIYPGIGNAICVYDSECIIKTPCIHATDEEITAGHRL